MRITWTRYIPLKLRSNTRQRATLLLLSSIYFREGRSTSYFIYGKRDEFNFHITNFRFLSSNIPDSPAYSFFISQLIRYALVCSSYECSCPPPPSKKEGHIALHMSVGMSVGWSVCRYPLTLSN